MDVRISVVSGDKHISLIFRDVDALAAAAAKQAPDSPATNALKAAAYIADTTHARMNDTDALEVTTDNLGDLLNTLK
ncbi:MAG: hypothetical protein ACJ71W_06010 [Terriglobales bacterium]